MWKNKLQLEFDIYSIENVPSSNVAQEIALLFTENYPSVHSFQHRKKDLARYKTWQQILTQIQNGNTWIVASINKRIIGIEKFRPDNRMKKDPFTKEYLCSWMIVQKKYRNSSVAEQLIEKHWEIIKERRQDWEKIISTVDFHKDNTPSKNFLKKHGYTIFNKESDDFYAAFKEI